MISGIDKHKIIFKFELDLLSSKTIAGSDLEVLVYFFSFSSSFELELLSTIVFLELEIFGSNIIAWS